MAAIIIVTLKIETISLKILKNELICINSVILLLSTNVFSAKTGSF